jgi:hypothetical protein
VAAEFGATTSRELLSVKERDYMFFKRKRPLGSWIKANQSSLVKYAARIC